ncbi:MAG TPA: ribbon-helix-helix domain-containing protein [Noviherbaspirillum sp.]|nr:ribbon-helix-helix domain-containing protein [Noviherbaspirillum sp.]
MCEIFVKADPALYEARARSIRLHGVVTSIRLENLFWETLAEIATRDGMTTSQLIAKLYDELVEYRGRIDNFASFLRVCCLRYQSLMAAGAISQDKSLPLAGYRVAAVAPPASPAMPMRLAPRTTGRSKAAPG